MTISLSLVLPAYNEAARLPQYLTAIRAYLPQCFKDDYEVIVVDDGSLDPLEAVLGAQTADWKQLRWLRHAENRGKGAAVRSGMLEARGCLCLFADADGATPIGEEIRLRTAIEQGADIAVGSRLVRSAEVVRRRSPLRAGIGRLFALCTRRWLHLPVRDTQCGFKMFRGEVGRELFEQSRESGYLFDIELLMLAAERGYRISEVPIHWSDRPGSQLHMRREGTRILRDLWRLRCRQTNLGTGRQSGSSVEK